MNWGLILLAIFDIGLGVLNIVFLKGPINIFAGGFVLFAAGFCLHAGIFDS